MKHFSFLLLIAASLQFSGLQAQVKTEFNNSSKITDIGKFSKSYKTRIDYTVPAKNIADLLEAEKKESARSNETKPFQLAVSVNVDLDIAKLISWIYEDDYAYGKYTLKLDSALSASINFDSFFLPKGTEMYIYNENGNMITGPVTDNENNASKVWGSWVYKGSYLSIEIKTPVASINELLLHSNNVAYGYKEIYKAVGFGNSGACQINVLCPFGNGWEPERNSVAMILNSTGSALCSGAMIMNTCNTNRPFFLTANHCYATNPAQNVSQWRFNFQDWSPTCNPSQNASGITYNGSTLRANWNNSDFCLVELVNTPPANSGIQYAGWTRSTVPAQNATGIHHPSGDVMKISRGNNPVTIASAFGTINQHWRVDWSPQNNGTGLMVTAVTEGGSSGSPLFDQNHRIIGQLSGGPSVCSGTQLWDFYGRFDLSWTGGGTNATRLSNWLDPNNTGAITTNTTNISALTPATFTISGPNSFCATSTAYTIPGLPAGATVTWSVSPAGIATPNTPNATSTTLTKAANGIVTLTAVITSCVNQTVQKNNIAVGVPPRPKIFDENGNEVTSVSVCTNVHQWLCPTVDPQWGILEWEWEKVTGNFNLIDFETCAQVLGFLPSSGFISVRVRNACGWSSRTLITVQVNDCSGKAMKQKTIRLFPNPAAGSVTLSAEEPRSTTEKAHLPAASINDVKIYDSFGNIKLYRKFTKQQTVTLDVSGLPKGVYVLEVDTGNAQEHQPLVISR